MENQMEQLLKTLYEQKSAVRQWNVNDVLSGEMPFENWKQGLHSELRQSLSLPTPLNDPEICDEKTEQQKGYTRRRITFLAEAGLRMPAYILEPDGSNGKTPVILCLHGHGYGCRDIVGLRDEESYQKKFALQVCSRKMIAFAPELAGFGELRLLEELESGEDDRSSCHRLAVNLLACGRTLLGMRVNQAISSLNIINELYPGHPVGIMGISGGATISLLTLALDSRIQAGVISGYANTYADSILAMHHCVDNYWPDMIGQMEMPDLLCSIAPKPMLWETGTMDPIYPHSAAMKAASAVQEVYSRLQASSSFIVDSFEGSHEIHGTAAFDFLRDHLSTEHQ